MDRKCRFCTRWKRSAKSLADHVAISHGLCWILDHHKWLCVCGLKCRDCYSLCQHYEYLDEDEMVDHILTATLRDGRG